MPLDRERRFLDVGDRTLISYYSPVNLEMRLFNTTGIVAVPMNSNGLPLLVIYLPDAPIGTPEIDLSLPDNLSACELPQQYH